MNILLISGHGAGDPGAMAKIDGVVYKEAEQTIALVKKIQSYLSRYAVVDIYPVERNAYADCIKGVLNSIANFKKYDYVFEVHFNACVEDLAGDGKTTGTECFVTTFETSANVETAILTNIAKLGFKNRGVKRKNFAVIKTAKKAGVSSALIETCFIDDADDFRLYLKKQDEVAKAISDGIVFGFKLDKKKPEVDYATLVCNKAGLEFDTKNYLNKYKFASSLWEKLWNAMK